MDAKEAIRIAMARVQELFSEGDPAEALRGMRLEEVDTTDDGGWLITVSFLPAVLPGTRGDSTTVGGSVAADMWPRTVIGVDSRRSYKEVEVSKDGEVKAIRLRPIVVR